MAFQVEDLYRDYRTILRPLVSEFESQNEQILPSYLQNIALMFDRVALLETSQDATERQEHLKKASMHLETAIKDTRDGVMASHIQTIDRFRQTYGQETLDIIKDGDFIGPFNALDREAHEAMSVDQAKAYGKLDAMVDMINDAHASAMACSVAKESRYITWLKWFLTILISLIVAFLTTWLW